MADVQRDVTLYYEGTDITQDVDIIECVCRDASVGESDCLDMLVDHADKWFRWNPQKNDRIRVTRGGYDTKNLFLNTIVPEEGAFRIYATGARCVPFPARYKSWEGSTFSQIMGETAGECGMGFKAYGVGAGYKYILRENMSAPAFMEWLANREGAVLKCLDGNFVAIGVRYAQGLPAMHEVELEDDQMDSEYIDRRDLSWKQLYIETYYGKGLATDSRAGGPTRFISDIMVDEDGQAKRWASGMLIIHNRQSEALNLEMDFNPGYTAMARVDVKSGTDAAGRWLVDSVWQNLLDGRTKARMLRCLESVG